MFGQERACVVAAGIVGWEMCIGGRTSPALWGAFFLMGLMNNAIPFSLIVWGQSHIASGLASILNATTPLFSVIVAHLFTQDERITPARLGGCLFFTSDPADDPRCVALGCLRPT